MTNASNTEALIEALAGEAAPVRRLSPPLRRAALWIAAIMVLGAGLIAMFADMNVFAARARSESLLVELVGTLVTACLATIAAFEMSLPDRSGRWALLPLPSLAVWLGGSGAGCWYDWFKDGRAASMDPSHSYHCFAYILGMGLPLTAALLWGLRASRPLTPIRVSLMGALAAAAYAAFLLQFFHPFDVTVADLALHLVAVLLVLAIGGASAKPALA